MNDWNIQGRSRHCQGCGAAFVDKQGYHTLLFEQRSGFERVDVCEPCWDEQYRHGASDRKGFVSHWQGVFLAPPPPPPEPIRKDSAEELLRQLVELNDPAREPAAFILAAMLERKRLLKARAPIQRDGRRVLVYEFPRTGEVFTIVDPELRLDQLEAVQRDVADLLERGLPREGAPVEEPFAPQSDPGAAQTEPDPQTRESELTAVTP